MEKVLLDEQLAERLARDYDKFIKQLIKKKLTKEALVFKQRRAELETVIDAFRRKN